MFARWTAIFVLSGTCAVRAYPAPTVSVSGGIQTGANVQPLIFTWNSILPLQGAGWRVSESISIALEGPLNSPGVTAAEVSLGIVTADTRGEFSASLPIPYDAGVTGPGANIPRPGLYEVRATGTGSGTASAGYRINLVPATYTGGASGIDWNHDRGTRIGVLDTKTFRRHRCSQHPADSRGPPPA